MTQEFVF